MLGAAAVLMLAAGCSSGSTSSAPGAAPNAPETSSGTASDPATCPDGAYVITALEGRGAASALGKGTGGNIAVDFTSGTFTLSSDGSGPVKLHIGPTPAELRFDGKITGTYAGDPSALRLTTTRADGEVSVKGFGFEKTRSADALANQLIGEGVTAQVTCDATGTAVVALPNANLTLARAGR